MARKSRGRGDKSPELMVLLTPAEVAAQLRVDQQTLANWRFRGNGPIFLKVGGMIRYSASDLHEFLRSARQHMTGHPVNQKTEVYQ